MLTHFRHVNDMRCDCGILDSSRTRGNLAKAWEFEDGSELVFKELVQVMQNLIRLAKIIDV